MNKNRNSQTGQTQDLGELADEYMRAFTELLTQYQRAERARVRRARRQRREVTAAQTEAAGAPEAGGVA